MEISFFAIIGFMFAAYAVVGNDALQTLGTFINSNSRLHWGWLFAFAFAILVATFTYGWIINGGDPSWGRLAKTSKYPVVEIEWYHTLPPLALLIITRFGVPVSTSFMVLTVFATVGGMTSMLQKSLIGYGLAFVVGLAVYLVLSRTLEKFFREHEIGVKAPWGLATITGTLIGLFLYFVVPLMNADIQYSMTACLSIAALGALVDLIAGMFVFRFASPTLAAAAAALSAAIVGYICYRLAPGQTLAVAGVTVAMFAIFFLLATKVNTDRGIYWVILQWVTTGYLWGVWLIQDFANIFVFLPRELTAFQGFAAMLLIGALLAYTFWNKGGPVQKILQAKTAVTDIRSATIIDFIYASLLFLFKEVSDIPMSTTFVFLGLIAGREYGFSLMQKSLSLVKSWKMSISDASKAFIGLAVSINMAVGLPLLGQAISNPELDLREALPGANYQFFIVVVNLMLIPVFIFLMKQDSKPRMIATTAILLGGAAAFFAFPPA